MTNNGNTWIGVNTHLTNKLAYEAIVNGTIEELQGFESIKSEVQIGDSRIDHCLTFKDKLCYVEVKNVTLMEGDRLVTFPDSVSTRGQKHILELKKIVESGNRGVMLYIVQREDCDNFSPAAHIDPDYARLLRDASDHGVEILVYQCELNDKESKVVRALKLSL
jgi:sugar fermentation stimulation protein A